MWKSGEKSIKFGGKIGNKIIKMWKWAKKKVATLIGTTYSGWGAVEVISMELTGKGGD